VVDSEAYEDGLSERPARTGAGAIGTPIWFGVASLDRFEGAPPGSGPADYLPGVCSEIVLGMRIPDGVMDVAGRYDEPARPWTVHWYGYVSRTGICRRLRAGAKAHRAGRFKGPAVPAHRLN
jgi:hypothetical protein